MIDAIDVDLDGFFTWLDKNVDGGMGNVWVALIGDHGVAPVVTVAEKLGIPAAMFDPKKLTAEVNDRLNQRFSPGKGSKYLLALTMPYIQLDPRPFVQAKVTEAEAEQAVAEILPAALEATLPPEQKGVSQVRLPARPLIRRVYTRVQMEAGQIPATEEGRLILHSYSPNLGWFVMASPGMYEMSQRTGTSHYSSYSYDRHVPLAFYGSAFVPGTYHDRVAPVDIAATFASLLRINQPSASVGQVLTMAMRPETGESVSQKAVRE